MQAIKNFSDTYLADRMKVLWCVDLHVSAERSLERELRMQLERACVLTHPPPQVHVDADPGAALLLGHLVLRCCERRRCVACAS